MEEQRDLPLFLPFPFSFLLHPPRYLRPAISCICYPFICGSDTTYWILPSPAVACGLSRRGGIPLRIESRIYWRIIGVGGQGLDTFL